jgi:predicted nuclease of predicted toxin-antitoxin system
MAAFYVDENVPPELSDAVRNLGHDVLTIQADGRASRASDDADVLARAIELGRGVVTNNRRDYHRLHSAHPDHAGIITYTNDSDRAGLALRIHAAVSAHANLTGVLIRIVRPNPPPQSFG